MHCMLSYYAYTPLCMSEYRSILKVLAEQVGSYKILLYGRFSPIISIMSAVVTLGRPLAYSDAIAEEICNRIADGESLNSICKDDHMPNIREVTRWVENEALGFGPKYAHARRAQLFRMADELKDIADDGTNDYVERETRSGAVVMALDREHVQRSDLRIKTRQWILARMMPERFGDRLAHQMLDEHGKPAKASGVVVIVKDGE